MTYLTSLIFALMTCLTGPTQGVEALTQAPVQAPTHPITAPTHPITYPATTITTYPAPTPITEAPTQPIQPAYEAPTQPIQQAPTQQATEQPTAAPTHPEAPLLTPQGVNPECSEQSMQTSADGTCIIGTVCTVETHTLDIEGNCGPRKDND